LLLGFSNWPVIYFINFTHHYRAITGPGASAQRLPGLKKPKKSGPLERSETLFAPRGPLMIGTHPQPSATTLDAGHRPPAKRAAPLPRTTGGLPPPTHPHQTLLLPEPPAEILVPPSLCKDVGPPIQICRRALPLTRQQSENTYHPAQTYRPAPSVAPQKLEQPPESTLETRSHRT
jgi:hypothetical protein